jgi:hypothetical protein
MGGHAAEVQFSDRVGDGEGIQERLSERRIPVALKAKNPAENGI